jgi:small subunit ribosomal protein S1
VVKKGDTVNVVILNIDPDAKRISLGLKQAEEDPWLKIGETYPVDTELSGTVTRLMDKGVVVDLGNDIEGFVPMSQLGVPDLQNPGDAVQEGQPVELKVLEVDPIHHRIVLAVLSIGEMPADYVPKAHIPMEDSEDEDDESEPNESADSEASSEEAPAES